MRLSIPDLLLMQSCKTRCPHCGQMAVPVVGTREIYECDHCMTSHRGHPHDLVSAPGGVYQAQDAKIRSLPA